MFFFAFSLFLIFDGDIHYKVFGNYSSMPEILFKFAANDMYCL